MTTIFYESDFTLLETIKDIAGNEIDPRSINFVISYYTDGQNKYQASHKNGKYVNCDYDAGSGKLIVIFAKHGLRPGILKHKLMVMSDDSLFPLGIRNDKSLAAIDITLSLTGGDAYTAEATMMVPALQITHSATLKDDIIDADEVNYLDSENGFGIVKTTWLNIKAKLKTYFDTLFEPIKAATDLYVTSAEKSTWNAKQDALTFSTDIEADKTSTTKVSAIKTFYDWAVGKFIDLSKIVTSWSAIPLDTNLASEKLVKDSLNLKADITPANGSTSALRALFIARGYDSNTNTYHCAYNTNTGYYEMNGLTDITEDEMCVIYNNSTSLHNLNLYAALSYVKCRTFYPLKQMASSLCNISYFCQHNNVLETFFTFKINNYPAPIGIMTGAFSVCVNLKIVNGLGVGNITTAANVLSAFYNCQKLEECYLHNVKVDFSFAWSPLLSLASLQYLVTNRANGTSRITITVHSTVWGYLNDAVGHQTWNALLVDAVNNQYIDFASA